MVLSMCHDFQTFPASDFKNEMTFLLNAQF